MKKQKQKRNRLYKKIFRTTFVLTYIGFIGFLFLFSTRITSADIDYFIKDTQKYTAQLISSMKSQKAAYDAKREAKLQAKREAEAAEKARMEEEKKAVAEAAARKQLELDAQNETILYSNNINLVYFSQTDPRWNTTIYGNDNTIGIYGCGPTTLAMAVTTLTDVDLTPDKAAKWSYDNGHFADNSGSYHSIIPEGAVAFGLSSKSLENPSAQTILDELNKGNLIIVLMNKGVFTSQGHFILLRAATDDGKVLVADSQNLENSQHPWEIQTILDQAKYGASAGGPFWSIGKP